MEAYHLLIDTCVWIAEGNEHPEIFSKLLTLVDQEKVTLVFPELVIEEWERHKTTKVHKTRADSIKGKLKNAQTLSEYMSEEDRKIFQDLLDHLNEDWIDEFAKEPVETLDTLIAHQATVILKVSKKAKKQAIQAALDKKAPFRSKNSMSDAIILFGFVEYVRKHNVLNSMFVSSNTTDFANPDNKRSIHPDLAPILESCKTVYFSNLGQAINCIEENLIDEDVVDEIEDNLELADYLQKLHAQPVAFWEEAGLKTGLFTEAWEKLLGENRLRMKGIGTVLRPLDRPRVNLIGEEIKRLREANELRLGSILGLSKEEMKRLRKEAFENLMQINQLYTDFQEQVARALLVDNWAADSEEE